jgi:hypothetical protein
MGEQIVLRNRDMWKYVQVTLRDFMPYIGKFTAPGGTHSSSGRWTIKTMADEEWVKGDPLMLQMIHEMAKVVETKACLSIVQPMVDDHNLTSLKKRTLESLNKEERKQVMETLAFHYEAHGRYALKDAEDEINTNVKKYYDDLQVACRNYRNYNLKEGIGLGLKGVSLFGGAVFTGIGLFTTISTMGAGAPVGFVQGALGIVSCLQNLVEIGEQLVRLAQEAEQMQWEINKKLSLLEQKHKLPGLSSQTGKVVGAVVEGAMFATVLKGWEGIIGISFKALGDLVDRYGSKVDGMDKRCHALARNLDVLLKKSEMADEAFNALPEAQFREQFQRLKNSINSPPDKMDWLRRRKDESVKRAQKINSVINNTSLLYGRIQAAHKVHAGYQARLDELQGKTAKTVYEVSSFLTSQAWTIAQVTFGMATMGKEVNDLVTGISGGVSDLITGPGYDTEMVVLDKIVLPT